MTHKEPSTTDEIAPLCKATFLSRDKAIAILWVIGGLLLSGATTAVTYALTTNNSVITMQEQTKNNTGRLDKLDQDINRKLDILINHK